MGAANGRVLDPDQLQTLVAAARLDRPRDEAITTIVEYGSQAGWQVNRDDAVYVLGIAAEREHQKQLFPASESQNGGGDLSRITRLSRPIDPWPDPVAPAAYHGLIGTTLRTIEPHTEADPHAILLTLLVALGNIVGRGPGFQAEGDFHATNLYTAIVGRTAKGRKGTSWGRAEQLLLAVEQHYVEHRVMNGLSSGEGVIYQVRDEVTTRRKFKKGDDLDIDEDGYVEEITDAGVIDKRLLVQESELAQALKVMRREGNTLSVTLRNLWDKGRQGALTKNSPTRCTGALVSVIGHITVDELRREMSETETANGFANRFLFCCAKRSKVLPDGGDLQAVAVQSLAGAIAEAVRFAHRLKGPLYRNDQARDLWHERYEKLSEGRLGMLGAATSRAEAQVMRIAVVYAVIDESTNVKLEHLQAAFAVWDYCERSARFIFGAALGDPVADEIIRSLKSRVQAGMSRNDIVNHFGRHKGADRIGTALSLLVEHGLIRCEQVATGGRPQERWYAVVNSEKSEVSEKSPAVDREEN